jgi:hypothetical protein
LVDGSLERVASSLPARRPTKIAGAVSTAFVTELTKYPRREAPVTSLKEAVTGAESNRHAVRRIIQHFWKAIPPPVRNLVPLNVKLAIQRWTQLSWRKLARRERRGGSGDDLSQSGGGPV